MTYKTSHPCLLIGSRQVLNSFMKNNPHFPSSNSLVHAAGAVALQIYGNVIKAVFLERLLHLIPGFFFHKAADVLGKYFDPCQVAMNPDAHLLKS